jgi:ABC-type nitrate/sulfonate/bicarbonate transport system ATPase subunit
MPARPLSVQHVSRSYGPLLVLDDINLTVNTGEFVALVGPSGCGKTTLLNLLSGYDAPTSGAIERPPHVRMVYQQDSLLPWLTVQENVALGNGKKGRQEDKSKIQNPKSKIGTPDTAELLDLVGMTEFANAYPHELSGGMRQRAELARALGGDTDLLLLDEPFSALDYLTRLRLRQELAGILKARPAQVVLVTHDIEEASQLADRVLVLSARPGRVRCEIPIALPRPRPPTHPVVVAATERILAEMGLEDL